MRIIYIDPNGNTVSRPRSLTLGEWTYIPPTDEQLISAGYEIREQEDPTPVESEPIEISLDEQYKWKVVELINQKYDSNDEIAILRQKDLKPLEFAEYNQYCEDCKAQAREEIYG